MQDITEANSMFYALRLLSHRLDTSIIEVTSGEEYPASEFTPEEQETALALIRTIEQNETVPSSGMSPEQLDFYLTALSDRIEDLANRDLAAGGFILYPDDSGKDELDSTTSQTAARVRAKARKLYEAMEFEQCAAMEQRAEYEDSQLADFVDVRLDADVLLDAVQRSAALGKVARRLGLSHATLLRRVMNFRRRRQREQASEARASQQQS
ncbi:MAG: hypothetical protein QOE77_1016 [Blastocatellia bacterium]|jgi:uncharacterized protein (DUF4415 family)|nr:hypothetical protein [Blastocatellia bacterium]